MTTKPYADIDPLLDELRARIRTVLGETLVGLYLYGSLVTGDFDHVHSDIDLLAVIDGNLDEEDFARLDAMHTAFVTAHPAWYDRVEIAYLAHQALKSFRTQVSPIAIISPGEPFHFKEAGKDWLINWWVVRRQGVALYGPPAEDVIDPITDAEFQKTVREQVEEWREWIYHLPRRKSQAYAILTMCRALHAYVKSEQVSKRDAADWAAEYFPEWEPLIRNAWSWRVAPSDEGVDHAATFAETVRFVHFAGDFMELEAPLGAADGDE
jgi:predicted nucleotidyltransferase